MKNSRLLLLIAAIFLSTSAVVYSLHYLIFRDVHHIFIYLIGDLGFLPLEAFIVVVVVERGLARREKQSLILKLNMVVGSFFSEVGNRLLGDLLKDFRNREDICRHLNVRPDWTARDFRRAREYAYRIRIEIDCRDVDLDGLKKLLADERIYLATVLENPNLLEHDRFTDMLWALTHLGEELEARASFQGLPPTDLEHLAGDIQRFYGHLAAEWIDYVEHLKLSYPYLYSLVLRMHPFQENPSPVVAAG